MVQSDECTIREKFLKDFVSDDLCSSRAQLFIASSKKGREINSHCLKNLEKVSYLNSAVFLFVVILFLSNIIQTTSTIGFDDASLTDSLASHNFQHDFQSTTESPNFLSVDRFMQYVSCLNNFHAAVEVLKSHHALYF